MSEFQLPYERLDEYTRQDIRLFGYYLFNGTIDMELLGESDYLGFLKKNPKIFGQACCVYINNLEKDYAHVRSAKWIKKCMDSSFNASFKDYEIDFTTTGDDVSTCFKKMVMEISHGSFVPKLLDGNYFSDMIHIGATLLEMAFAIWGNVIKIREGQVINLDHAEYRTAQWIKGNLDLEFKIEPKFESWETELV